AAAGRIVVLAALTAQLGAFLHLDDLVGDHPVRLPVHGRGGLLAGRFHQTEYLAGALVVPVSQVLHTVLGLGGQVLLVCVGQHLPRQVGDAVVHVEVEGHRAVSVGALVHRV